MIETRFKDTEIGRIPEDWEVFALKEKGLLQKNSINPQAFKDKEFIEFSMPSYDEGKQPIVKKGGEMQSNRTCITGSVLLFNKLNVRQQRIWHVHSCPQNAVCSMEFLPYSSNNLNLQLLQYLLGTTKTTEDFIGMSRGTSNSQKRIAPSDFLEYKIAFPQSSVEQSRIASTLSNIDALISELDKLIKKKRAIKQGTMQELLTGKKRLEGFISPWQNKKLGDVCNLFYGYLFTPDQYVNTGKYKVITISNVKDGVFTTKDCNKVNITSDFLNSYQYLKIGDVLISMTGNLGRVAIVNEENCVMNYRVGKIETFDIDKIYCYHMLNQKKFQDEMTSAGKGAAQLNISKDDILNYKITIPSNKSEQKEIAKILSIMDTEIIQLESKRAKYQAIKEGMMQQLLTGKIRLI